VFKNKLFVYKYINDDNDITRGIIEYSILFVVDEIIYFDKINGINK
jgi:hypothetical protein